VNPAPFGAAGDKASDRTPSTAHRAELNGK